MRKIIYIGQGCQQSVYYNTKTREALATESSASSETDGAISSKKSKWPWVVFFIFLLVAIISIWIRSLIAPFRLSEWMAPIHLAAILFVLSEVFMDLKNFLQWGLSRLSQQVKSSLKKQLKVVNFGGSHQIRNQQSIKSSCIYLLSSFFYSFLLLLCSLPYLGPSFLTMSMNGLSRLCLWYPSEQQSSQLVSVLLLFQNNPIRWLLAVRKYKQGKVIFGEKKN